MTEEREKEIRGLSREEQKQLLDDLRQKYPMVEVPPGKRMPVYNGRQVAANDEEMDFLEGLLKEPE